MKRLMMKTIIDYQNDEREKVLLDVRDKQEFEKETYLSLIHISEPTRPY